MNSQTEKFIEQHINKIINDFNFENRKKKNPDECPCYKSGKCHKISELNCFLCYCPEYDNSRIEGGCKINSKDGKWFFSEGKKIWDCTNCNYPHKEEIVRKYLKELFKEDRMEANEIKEKALEYHREKNFRAGKIGTEITKEFKKEFLPLAYTPGVASPCLEIKKNPEDVYDYTNKGNSVAVITNGTAVLGLGNIGVLASKPVMEGKAMLFKKFGDVDAVDVLIDSQEPNKIIEAVKLISKTYGAINLEDIKAPECFEVEKKLKEILEIPVFHDDQHGTAVAVGAGLLNALEIAEKKIDGIKVVFSGAGAAGIACAKFFLTLGVKRENIIMCDSKGVINKDRNDLNNFKKEFATNYNLKTLGDAVNNSDVFVGVSVKDIFTSEMLKTMNKNPIVFAMANPNPEIKYETAIQTREDIIMATGRSDYSNQINNVLVFPFIFRGALDVRAKEINEKMKISAAKTLAKIAREDERFGKKYIIPEIWDKKIAVEISFEVAKSAIESGVARKKINLEEYKNELKERLGKF